MKHLDHIRTADYNSLTDFEKEALFKLIKEKHGLPVVTDLSDRKEIHLSYGFHWESQIGVNDWYWWFPLLSLEELREYVAMGMLLWNT